MVLAMKLLLFNVVGISDLKREEGKGSFYIIISFLVKSTDTDKERYTVAVLLLSVELGDRRMAEVQHAAQHCKYSSDYAVIIQYLFVIMVEDALKDP